jgi:hypothetical protein
MMYSSSCVNAWSFGVESGQEERMTAESCNAPFRWCCGAFAWHRGRWGGRRRDRGPLLDRIEFRFLLYGCDVDLT